MRLFLPENIWKEKQGFTFDRPANYLKIGFHGGQDFFTLPVGTIPVYAPCDGELITFPGFSKSAGWWGAYTYGRTTFHMRFGTWNKALLKAGLKPAHIINYSDAKLFENILNVWEKKGAQPVRTDMNTSMSEISSGAYNRNF